MPVSPSAISSITLLGLGAMGQALARRLIMDGYQLTVWNRNAARAEPLAAIGASVSAEPARAIEASELVIICTLDHVAVRDTVSGCEAALSGRSVINLTTTTPAQSRALSTYFTGIGARYVGGAIMATPELIGEPQASLLYSGEEQVYVEHKSMLQSFGGSIWLGDDPGAAAMYDLAMLSGMYAMFAAFETGGRMVQGAGGTAAGLAGMMTPFLQAMAESLAELARGIDRPDSYQPVQSAEFTAAALDLITAAIRDAGADPELMSAARKVLGPR